MRSIARLLASTSFRSSPMHDTPEAPFLSPDHATAIGYVAANWALVEDHLGWLIYNLLGLQSMPGEAVTAELPALQRLVLIRTLVGMTGNVQWIERWASLSNEIDTLRIERNNVIHGVWRGDQMTLNPINRRVKAKGRVSITFTPFDPLQIFELSGFILRLANDIAKFNINLVSNGAIEILRSPNPPGPPQPQGHIQQARIRDQKRAQKEAQRAREKSKTQNERG